MKKYCLLFTTVSVFLLSCTQNNNTSITAEGKAATKETTKVTVAPNAGLVDDSVFADGSVPTDWETAGITNVFGLKMFISELQQMVTANKKVELSYRVKYPINDKVKSREDFIANYESVFTEKVKQALQHVNFRQIFRNSKGVMIGNGELWIAQFGEEYLIIAINN
jgi:hypothetical protein